MDLNDRGINAERDSSTRKAGINHLPFVEGDDVFLKKKPVNLFITLALAALTVALAVFVAKHYYEKVNDLERLRWESGRINKAKTDKENAKKHDLFQPLRENWAQYITSDIVVEQKTRSSAKNYFVVLENKSPQPLDRVVVNIYSVNWNGEASNMRSFSFLNVKPQETQRIKIEVGVKSKNALSLIKSVRASSFSFCFDKDMETGRKSDPYYCNQDVD